MKTIIPAVGALALALALPQVADAQDRGNGNGRGGGQERGNQDRGGGQERGGGNDDRGRGGGENRGREARQDRGDGRGGERPEPGRQERAEVRQEPRGRDDDGGRGRGRGGNDDRPVVRDVVRAPQVDRGRGRDDDGRDAVRVLRAEDRPDVLIFRDVPDRGLIAGCPPGLARKNNGCLPPGQARRIARDWTRYDYVWNRWDDGYRYRYGDGYLYRYDDRGALMGWLPALGGALGLGNAWPTQYAWRPAPTYYRTYYRLPDGYDYRYADGVLYGLDPRTQAISQVAALLTGQQWNVGQAMPVGYDVYNVPYAYRDRYYDTPDRWYRYSDGYVYQVDPTARLVQAVVQLLT